METQSEEKARLLQRFSEMCRLRGLAVTVQRRTIYQCLLDRANHPTADDVYEDVIERIPSVSRTTVYRVLDALDRLGVIIKISHPGTPARYDINTERHHHLVCRYCEKLIDFEAPRLDTIRLPDTGGLGFEIIDYCIHFRGVCAECREKPGEPPAGASGNVKHKASRPSGRKKSRIRRRRTEI